jgi:putative DNA primase/helicase
LIFRNTTPGQKRLSRLIVRQTSPPRILSAKACGICGCWPDSLTAQPLRPDGSVLDQPGYDERTGIFYDPRGVKFPEIPERPTRDDAVLAIKDIKALIRDFPFVDDASRSVAISGILTALIRRSIPHAPLHSFSAPVAGSGKSKLVDVASMHANGHRAPVVSPGSTPEEMEKQLGSMLIAGDRLISFDNCEKPLGGPLLCQCLTQPFVKPPLLGKSENPDVPSDAIYFATGKISFC